MSIETVGRVGGRRMERVKGIEPSYAAWEAAVLPLNYTRAPHAAERIIRQSGLTPQSGEPNPEHGGCARPS